MQTVTEHSIMQQLDRHCNNKELLELASQFTSASDQDGNVCIRGPDGALPDWNKYAAMHPENMVNSSKCLPPTVCHGRKEWRNTTRQTARTSTSTTSVITWNILSDTWYRQGEHDLFSHTQPEHGQWQAGRLSNLLEWFESLDADILSLQEVDFDKFDQDLLPALHTMGYEGIMQKRDRTSSKRIRESEAGTSTNSFIQPCGVATFWKSSKWAIKEHKSFSRSMALIFEEIKHTEETSYDDGTTNTKILGLVNAHLESSQSQEGATKRARQLNSPLAWLSGQRKTNSEYYHADTIICGDFNTGADAALLDVFRRFKWHGQDWASVYEHPVAYGSFPVCRATYCIPHHHYFIDHIVYSHERLKLRHILNPFTRKEIDDCLGDGNDRGFPSALCPSDHVPIGALFEFLPMTGDERVLDLENEKSLAERHEQLREEYYELLSSKPQNCSGKPSKEHLNVLREYKSKLKKWKHSFKDYPTDFAFVTALINGKA